MWIRNCFFDRIARIGVKDAIPGLNIVASWPRRAASKRALPAIPRFKAQSLQGILPVSTSERLGPEKEKKMEKMDTVRHRLQIRSFGDIETALLVRRIDSQLNRLNPRGNSLDKVNLSVSARHVTVVPDLLTETLGWIPIIFPSPALDVLAVERHGRHRGGRRRTTASGMERAR